MTSRDPMRWGFVADDLTGACLVGGLLADAGVPSVVLTGPPDHRSTELVAVTAVIGCNAESRVGSTIASFAKVRSATSWLERQGCTHLFKFVDSTLRGHVGSELEAMLASKPGARAVVVPGTPSARRTIVAGQLLCDGVPARSSPLATYEVLSPLATDNVADLFRQSSTLRFAALGEETPRPEVGPGDRVAEAIERHLAAGTIPIADAPDAAAIEHVLRVLVDRNVLTGLHVLCGSAGLASAWSAELAIQRGAAAASSGGSRAFDDRRPGPPVLVVCGSRSPTSLSQIAHLRGAGVPVVPLYFDQDAIRHTNDVVAELEAGLDAGGAAALIPSTGASAPVHGATTELRAAHHEDGERAAAIGLVDALADTVASVMARRRIRALVLVGGMTAAAVLRVLNVRVLEPMEHHDFVVRSSARIGAGTLGSVDQVSIVTKGGSSGSDSVLTSTVARLSDGRGLCDIS